jgi:group II intron reverse transcriptase/maturase
MTKTSSFESVSTKQQRIAELAKQNPTMALTSLNHYLDVAWLREAFRRTRKDGAPGVDGQTWATYGENLEENLRSLLDRAKSGTYRSPPVRRVHIPKGTGGETRPIGIPTLEDKVLQRAVAMILEAIYEEDFCDCSYGFRPGRSAHQALDALWQQTMGRGGGWILDMDIRKFFDTLDHGHLREFLRQRVRDGVLLRLIGKWLKAGVMEDGRISYPESGSPQGGVISPLLANVFLHYVLDKWFAEEVVPRMKGRAFLIRYADDAVMGFTHEEDARRVLAVLPKRLGKYGLTVHPEKTKLVDFRQPPHDARPKGGPRGERPGTFDLLGFTHFWARSRKGHWVVKRKTSKSRFTRAVRTIAHWCRDNRHRPIAEQHAALSRKLRGHYAYYGITGNSLALNRFRDQVQYAWRKWLARRNSKTRPPWDWFHRLRVRYRLPYGIAIHSVCRRRSEVTT